MPQGATFLLYIKNALSSLWSSQRICLFIPNRSNDRFGFIMKLCVVEFRVPNRLRADVGLVVVCSVAEPFLYVVEDAAPECGVFLLVFLVGLTALLLAALRGSYMLVCGV